MGVLFCTRLSQSTIWPEYVPPKIKFGWNLANVVAVTGDWQWKMNSGVVFLNFVFQIRHTPSGSFGVSPLLLYEAAKSSGNCGDQSMQVTQRLRDHRSQMNERFSQSRWWLFSSLQTRRLIFREWSYTSIKNIHATRRNSCTCLVTKEN